MITSLVPRQRTDYSFTPSTATQGGVTHRLGSPRSGLKAQSSELLHFDQLQIVCEASDKTVIANLIPGDSKLRLPPTMLLLALPARRSQKFNPPVAMGANSLFSPRLGL